MLSKAYRLRNSLRIAQVRRQGQSCRNSWLVLCRDSGECAHSRFAFSASRRLGNAVARNRVKRRMREAVRCHLACIDDGWDLLFVARVRARDATYHEIECAVADLLRQSGLWVPPDALIETEMACE